MFQFAQLELLPSMNDKRYMFHKAFVQLYLNQALLRPERNSTALGLLQQTALDQVWIGAAFFCERRYGWAIRSE